MPNKPKFSLLLSFIFYLLSSLPFRSLGVGGLFLTSPVHAAGLSISPAYQEIILESTQSSTINPAIITYQNQTTEPINLDFSVVKIIATDLIGRLQFNAPLPQTLQNTDPNLYEINPNHLSLNPGESATVSAVFNPAKLNPGTTAFLLLAQINNEDLLGTNHQAPSTNLDQYLGSSILVNTLGGHQTKLELIQFSLSTIPIHFSHPDYLSLTIKNSGNTRSVPKGVVIITDQFGREVMRGAINPDSATILPGSQRLIYARLQPSHQSWPISLNRLKITGSDDVSQSPFQSQKYYLYLNPYFTSGIGAISAIIIYLKKKYKSRLTNNL